MEQVPLLQKVIISVIQVVMVAVALRSQGGKEGLDHLTPILHGDGGEAGTVDSVVGSEDSLRLALTLALAAVDGVPDPSCLTASSGTETSTTTASSSSTSAPTTWGTEGTPGSSCPSSSKIESLKVDVTCAELSASTLDRQIAELNGH